MFTGEPFEPVDAPVAGRVGDRDAARPAPTAAPELWKLNHYYERLDDWHPDDGHPREPVRGAAADPVLELHNLTVDPEERRNRAEDVPGAVRSQLRSILDTQRDAKRLLPTRRNPSG